MSRADETFILESFKGRWSDLPFAGFARRAGIPFRAVPAPGKPTRETPHLHINNVNAYHGRFKQWLSRFNGVATKNLPSYLGWRRAIEAWSSQPDPPKWILTAIGTDHINR